MSKRIVRLVKQTPEGESFQAVMWQEMDPYLGVFTVLRKELVPDTQKSGRLKLVEFEFSTGDLHECFEVTGRRLRRWWSDEPLEQTSFHLPDKTKSIIYQ